MYKIVHIRIDQKFGSKDTDYESMTEKEAFELCMDLNKDAIDSKEPDRWIMIEV